MKNNTKEEKDPFVQLCVWPGCCINEEGSPTPEKIKEFEQFMAENFYGTRVKFIEEVKVEGTGDRPDLFFYVHTEDLGRFAVPRLAYGIRWWEDVVDNKSHLIYPQEVLDKYLKKEEKKKPVAKLSGMDGNVFGLIGVCQRALNNAGLKDEAIKMAHECFKCESYDEALQVMMRYVDVE